MCDYSEGAVIQVCAINAQFKKRAAPGLQVLACFGWAHDSVALTHSLHSAAASVAELNLCNPVTDLLVA